MQPEQSNPRNDCQASFFFHTIQDTPFLQVPGMRYSINTEPSRRIQCVSFDRVCIQGLLSNYNLALDLQLAEVDGLTGLLLCEGDVGVHKAPRNTGTQHTHIERL